MSRLLYRLGSRCARHRYVVIAVWVVAMAAALGMVSAFGAKTNNSLDLPGTGSQRAFDILAARFPPQQNGTSPFVFHAEHGTLTDAAHKPAMNAVYRAIEKAPHVYSVLNPVSQQGEQAGILSKDKTIGFMPVLLDVDSGFITVDLAQDIVDVTAPARAAGIEVAEGGPIGSALSAPETRTSEILGNLAAMVILTLVFGSLVAMGLPIVTAIVGLAISISVIGLLGHLIAVPSVAPTLATMIGLGVGIDYALFLVTRHKEELAKGTDMHESIARSVAGSGSAIVFAGGTVVIALLSLTVAGIPLVSTLGLASAIAVLTAVLGSITLLPALLSAVGRGIDRLHVPSFLQLKPRSPGATRWDSWARAVTGHPWVALGVSAAILAPLIVPLFSLRLGQEDVGVTPTSTTERQAYDLMTQGFGIGFNGPLLIANELTPPAAPSAAYTKKYDEATSLQRQLKREQKRLKAQQQQLLQQQANLERQQAALEAQAASLKRHQASLEAQKAQLEAEKARLESEARALIRKAAPLVAHLAAITARERIVERLISQATDPQRRKRLRRRLNRLRAREQQVRAKLAPLEAQGRSLLRQAQALQVQAGRLQAQADQLQRQADVLTQRAASLQRQADALKAQADALKRQQQQAEAQKQRALALKAQLTTMLTKAGGDPRGTDPRIVKLQNGLGAPDGVQGLSPPQINKKGDAAILSVIATTAPSSKATADLVRRLRVTVIPASTSEGGIATFVGGSTASNVDLATKIASRLPVVVLTVIVLSFLLLMVAFRSLLIPLQAAITNLLCVAAALGVLTATFQWGWGLKLVGLPAPNGTVPIASYVPLMMFAVLFGLSMDYEVFMMSRIEQHHAAGEAPREAVRSGVGAAAYVVTSAALIMILVFASFIINGDPTVKQFGVGLSVAVLLAGTMVVLLAPAMLTLFGRGVFWVPRALGRILPHLNIEGEES